MNCKKFRATRLAPSPTGALHLGHARTFLIAWWMARQAGARIFMRMEDLDATRARADSVQQAYDDLRWLGIDWDPFLPPLPAPPDAPGGTLGGMEVVPAQVEEGIVVQSRRVSAYEQALERLWTAGAIYPCTCTRAQIAASVAGAGNAPHEADGLVRYPGMCAALSPSLEEFPTAGGASRAIRERTGKPVCWRLRVASPGRKPGQTFTDCIAGVQSFDVEAEVGDFPITRFLGEAGAAGLPAAYQLACVVDDHAMGIDRVVRGDDLLSSTPRQMLLYQALGWSVPSFAHVPLVVGADGKRLAKRHGESRIAQFRQAGVPRERIVGWVAWRSGMLDAPAEISAADLLPRFDLLKVPGSRIVLSQQDFQFLK